MRRLAGIALLVAAAAVLAAAPARASDLDQFGFGARPISMGGAFTALASDWTGTYYNPAAIAAGKSLSIGLGFSYGDYSLKFEGESSSFDRKTERQQPLSALTFGVSGPLGAEDTVLGRVALGLGVFLPTRQIVGAEVQTGPGEPEYFLYGSRRDKVGILPAIAFRILPLGDIGQTLSIGVGATVLADIGGTFSFNLANAPASSVSTDLNLTNDIAPNVGVFYWPVEWLSFGVTYRGALSLKADFDVDIDLDGVPPDDFPLELEAVTLYQPQQVALGVAVDPADWLTIAFDLTWYNWAAFDDPFITIRPIVGQIDPDFRDIIVPRLGIEIEPVRWIALRFGYYYQESPIPTQSGETTLVDLDKHVLSFGVGLKHWTLRDKIVREGDEAKIVQEEANPVSLDLFVQWHHLIGVEVEKDDPATSPVGGSFKASGEILNCGIQLSFKF